jgi:glycosyltransferase involved in cell wall biosynthesis
MTKVSVVLPTYNRLGTLPRAIESVLAQTYKDLELLIVDDGSTDGTADYLKKLTDPRIRAIGGSENRGVGSARNVGIAEAKGELIAFQDSDDEWLVTFLEKHVANLDSQPAKVGVSYCGKIIYGRDEAGRQGKRRAAYMPDVSRTVVEGNIYHEVLRNAVVSTQTFVARADVLRSIGGFAEDLKIGLDWELSTRLAQVTEYAFIDEPLVMTFLMQDSISHKKHESSKTLLRIFEQHQSAFKSNPDLNSSMSIRIGRALQKTGRKAEARQFIRQGLTLSSAPKLILRFAVKKCFGVASKLSNFSPSHLR